jgi:glycine cleavage system aminomethyltransferase T
VHLDKQAEFLGREALRRIEAAGNHRRLVGIDIAGDPIPGNESFWPVSESGEKLGHVSRCVFSPRLKRNIGFANVPATHTNPGTRLNLDAPDGPRQATVVKAPWFPAQKDLPSNIRN